MAESPPSSGHDVWEKIEALVRQRYGQSNGETLSSERSNPADVHALELLLERRSSRSFLDTPVTETQLRILIGAAQSASTSSNLQPFSIVAVRDRGRLLRIAELASDQKHVRSAPLLLIFVTDLSRLRSLAASTGVPVDALDFMESLVVGVVDASLAAQSAAIAAEALGLGTCFIGAIRNHPERLAEELNLPNEAFGLFGLVVGTPDPRVATQVKPRLPPSTVLHLEQYRPHDPADIARYDEAMAEFQRRQDRPAEDWSRKSAQRVSGPEPLSGRHRLLEALRARGFQLR